jgi:hypothetical protein
MTEAEWLECEAMTEQDWFSCTEPQQMVKFLREGGTGSERKCRLFACASARRIWHLLADQRLGEAIAVSERHADGRATDRDLGAAVGAAHRARRKRDDAWRAAYDAARYRPGRGFSNADSAVLYAISAVGSAVVPVVPPTAVSYFEGDRLVTEEIPMSPARAAWNAAVASEKAAQAVLLRDVFGALFHPVPIDPAWLAWNDGTVVKLAQAAYEHRDLPSGHLDTTRLGILADALEEAGCSAPDILGHLRGPGPHVRGCWAVDLLLGKE